MRRRIGEFALLVAAIAFSSGAEAMNTPRCTVLGSEKLPVQTGGENAICGEVEQAITSLALNVSFSAEIKVLARTRLAATLVVNGRTLPELKFAIVDRDLDSAAIRRFAQSLASEVAKAAKA
jgi:hypothetical protein